MKNCLDCSRPLKFKREARGHTRCYFCHLKHKYDNDTAQSKITSFKQRMHKRKDRPRRAAFTCDMGYADCEKRRYCNGDC